MPDWSASMRQTFEYYKVDPGTWRDISKIENITSSTITRDSSVSTLGSATIETTDSEGEYYFRIYLITIQNGVREKHPLGTFLAQTPSSSFDGKFHNYSIDAYTPLIELKEKLPPIGYSINKNSNIMDYCYRLTRENARAPVVGATCDETLFSDFVSNTDDTWLAFLVDLLANAKHSYDLDEMGRILFAPVQEISALQPRWTYDDGNSSILYSDITINRDLYGIPNVVEVVYSNSNGFYHARAVNNSPSSPISTVNRGREIVYRVTNADIIGDPSENRIKEYAERVLSEMSSIEYTVSYKHGYCPTRVGDCVLLNCPKAGLDNVKAKIISQSIKCEPGCPVSEKAVFNKKLWR